MLLHCGNAGILLLCNKVLRAATASLQGTMSCGTKQLHIALQSPLSPWSATLITTEGEKLCVPDFWWMHLQEHEVISASVLAGRIPPCSSYGGCCCAFQHPLSRTQGSARSHQHCPASPSQISYRLPVTPVTKKNCRCTLVLILYQLHIRVHLVVLP